MKEKDKEALEAEIEEKASNEVSDTELDGVSGGVGFCAKRVCTNLKKGTRVALDTSKAAMSSLDSSDSLN